jgi:hypothetical protein
VWVGLRRPRLRAAGYRRGMHLLAERLPMLPTALRAALIVFVLAAIFGPYEVRSAVPVWIAFLVALGLEVNFFLGALGRAPAAAPDRGPQEIDRELYGYRWPDEYGDDLEVEEVLGFATPVRQFLLGVAVIGALVLLWLVMSRTGWDSLSVETRTEAQDRFSEEASVVAGKQVRVRCDESGEYVGAVQHADGVATVGGDLTYLTPERCLDLYRLAFDGEVTGSQTGRAIAVLAHEAWHLRGVREEGVVECYAFQSGVALGQRLGLSEDTARRLMRQQLVENSGRSGSAAEYRVPAGCRDSGALDLDPESSRFP